MKTFTLRYQEQLKPLSDWGITGLQRFQENQGDDALRLTVSIDALPFVIGEKIALYDESIRLFEGVLTQAPSVAMAASSHCTYEAQGPFWYLENLVYQQSWKEATEDGNSLNTCYKGRVVLGHDAQGAVITAQPQLQDILAYAMACEMPLAIGDIRLDIPFPIEETRDLTCAQALYAVLRWAPDCVVWWHYACEGHPQLMIRKAAELESLTLDMNNGRIERLKLTPRHDLQIEGVVLQYEKTHHINGTTYLSTQVEAYPAEASPRKLKTLVLTLELEGVRGQELVQPLVTQLITPNQATWWKAHLPSLSEIETDKITIQNITRQTELPYELVEGSISNWMDCDVADEVVSATLSYETQQGSLIEHCVAVRIKATSAVTKTYRQFITQSLEQAAPQGLAQSLYEALHPVFYDGDVIMQCEDTVQGDVIGKALSLLGGQAPWATMHSPIQVVMTDFALSRIRLKIGPPEHLGLDDFAQLMRANRQRQPLNHAGARATGRIKSASKIQQPSHHRLENADRGHSRIKKWIVSDRPEPTICLDAAVVPADTFVSLREESVCENGYLLKRLVLASDPYYPADEGGVS